MKQISNEFYQKENISDLIHELDLWIELRNPEKIRVDLERISHDKYQSTIYIRRKDLKQRCSG